MKETRQKGASQTLSPRRVDASAFFLVIRRDIETSSWCTLGQGQAEEQSGVLGKVNRELSESPAIQRSVDVPGTEGGEDSAGGQRFVEQE